MKTPTLFWKLFLIFAVFQLGTVIAFVMQVTTWQEQQTFAAKGLRLRDAANILRQHLPEDFATLSFEERQRIASQIQRDTMMRLTVVAMDGSVLADSDQDPAKMENHQTRPELADAVKHGTGSSKRFSPTIQVPMLYQAARIDNEDGTPRLLVRVAIRLADVQAELLGISRTLWMVAAVVSIAGLVLAYMVVSRALTPIQNLTRAAHAMAAGRYQNKVEVGNPDEIGQLAVSFNHMGREIEARENDLRAAADRISAILGGMIEGVVAVDAQQNVLFANQAAGRQLGFKPSRVEGKPMESVGNASLITLIRECLDDTSARSNDVRTVELNNPSSGTSLSINAARLPGEPCPGVVLVMHNVTELRRLESLRQEFVANVSHELKTPLSAIIAYSETLQNGALKDPDISNRFVNQIREQADRLSELIQDMLSLARIESGQTPFEITTLNVSEIVNQTLVVHRETAAQKNIELEVQGNDSLTVLADDEALRQIIDNLINNAIKYTVKDGQINVKWQQQDDRIVLEISDNGIGIAPEHHARIFERFYRADKARSRELGGTGLGLSIVKHLTQVLGGSVSLQSEVGKGSKFRVDLRPGSTKSTL